MPTEREEFMDWLRSLPGFGLTPGEAVRRWQARLCDRDAAERYRRAVEQYPHHPHAEEHE